MKIRIDELMEKISKYLFLNGLNNNDADTLINLVIEQKLVGNQFSIG